MKTITSFLRPLFMTVLIAFAGFGFNTVSAQPAPEVTATGTSSSVRLVSFSGATNGNKADLKWVTEAEVNLSHFIIEKSNDGVNYSDAGVFFAYGTGTEKTNYSITISQENAAATVYYRLFVTGSNGKGFYSEPVIVKSSK